MTRRRALPGVSPFHVGCPFCGEQTARPPTATPWCANRGCGIEYRVSRSGCVWFDDELRTSTPLAKAIWGAGGMRMGRLEEKQ